MMCRFWIYVLSNSSYFHKDFIFLDKNLLKSNLRIIMESIVIALKSRQTFYRRLQVLYHKQLESHKFAVFYETNSGVSFNKEILQTNHIFQCTHQIFSTKNITGILKRNGRLYFGSTHSVYGVQNCIHEIFFQRFFPTLFTIMRLVEFNQLRNTELKYFFYKEN